MFRLFVFFLMLLTSAQIVWADDYEPFKNKNLRIYADVADFYWDERYNNEKLLEETGAIFGTGVTFKGLSRQHTNNDAYRLTYGFGLGFDFGQVDYDGQTQDGTPAQTDVNYLGMNLGGQLGWLFKTSADWLFIEPNLNLALTTWYRDLQSTDSARGYKENWTNIYGRAGLTFSLPFKHDYMFCISGGAIIPLYVKNEVNDITDGFALKPKAFHPTPYANLAFEYKKFGIEMFYESFLFGESDGKFVEDAYFLQPESYTYRLGLRLMYTVFE